MEEHIENTEKVINHWRQSADQHWVTLQNLLITKDFSWALFMGHLVLEKLLKALYVQKFHKHAIFSHDLLRLARKTELDTTEEQEEWLDEITTFNLNARYDNYKQNFQQRCTFEFTKEWVSKIEILKKWLIGQF